MKLTNLTIKDLLNQNEKLTFLVGAGCSVDPPSCLPAGRQMMEAIIKYTCAESEIEKILELEDLRFEQLIEIVRDSLDKELKIIDYYSQCDKPNLQHFFLAEMIKKGHFVMTTNFDFLIEYALISIGVPKDEILPVITKVDFIDFNQPNELFRQGKKAVYKIHGSIKNIITGEETRDSLIATLQALGSNKEGQSLFQVENYKRPLFDNISQGRTLIILGYSGSDDFDIVPTLKMLKNLNNLIWVNHIAETNAIKIYEINKPLMTSNKELNKLDQFLFEFKKLNDHINTYRVDVKSSILINNFIEFKINIDPIEFYLNPIEWFKKKIKDPDIYIKNRIPYHIYFDLGKFYYALKSAFKLKKIAEESNNQLRLSVALSFIGKIYLEKEDYEKTLKYLFESIKICEKIKHFYFLAINLNDIGGYYFKQKNYAKAMKYFKRAGNAFFKNKENWTYLHTMNLIISVINLGECYRNTKDYSKSIRIYKNALNSVHSLGQLSLEANFLNNLGGVYADNGNHDKALEYYEKAYKIEKQLGNSLKIAICISNIGDVYERKKNYRKALEKYKEAEKILIEVYSKKTRLFKDLKWNINNLENKLTSRVPKKKIKINRNDPCPCGSGKKYKNCHWKKEISRDILKLT